MNVSGIAIALFTVKNTVDKIAKIQSNIGKYGALEKMSFSSFVTLERRKPIGSANMSVKYSIIKFLSLVYF